MPNPTPLDAARSAGFTGDSLPWFGAFMAMDTPKRHDVQCFCPIPDISLSINRVAGKIAQTGKPGRIYDWTGRCVGGWRPN